MLEDIKKALWPLPINGVLMSTRLTGYKIALCAWFGGDKSEEISEHSFTIHGNTQGLEFLAIDQIRNCHECFLIA